MCRRTQGGPRTGAGTAAASLSLARVMIELQLQLRRSQLLQQDHHVRFQLPCRGLLVIDGLPCLSVDGKGSIDLDGGRGMSSGPPCFFPIPPTRLRCFRL